MDAVHDAEGVCHTAVEAGHVRQLETIFGEVSVTRLAYRAKGAENLYLQDAALNLPTERHSHGLRERCATEATRGSYEEAQAAIVRATGIELGKRQVEQLARRVAEDVDAFYEQAEREGGEETDALVISADAKGIVMRPDALRPATRKAATSATHKLTTRLSKGEKTNRKRMAELAVVYDCKPVPRTPADIFARAGDNKPEAPVARAKWCTASVTADAGAVIEAAFEEAERRDPEHLRPWVGLVDGNNHQIKVLRSEARRRGVEITILVDLVHVLEYLWGAAWCFFDEGDPEAEAWVKDKALAVLAGRAGIVAGAIGPKAVVAPPLATTPTTRTSWSPRTGARRSSPTIANGIAADYGFWLGDAFASGGSAGYDHKAIGITARGAWESVKRHFRELGVDVGAADFTVVGIGDMSGDVFGNGMLQSPHIKLVAAFDHRHIFLDPQPDPADSFEERQRLFRLPRSSWADYDPALISDGGGVHQRTAKAIPLSPPVQQLLGLEAPTLTPNELIRAILRAPVDLLWKGGIGTYVKARRERNTEVGDKTNDAVRVDAVELRCRVVAEGGNLGFTQAARVEHACDGGRVNTDAIDNSAGVDCSDHQVNLKILLDRVVAEGDMTEKQRNVLLAEMTDEVAGLVLRDNYLQNQALSFVRAVSSWAFDLSARYLRALELHGKLDRAAESLPNEEELAERRAAGRGFTGPELAVLMAHSKITLYEELLASDVPDDPYYTTTLERYFPTPLRARLRDAVHAHPLRREIVASCLANDVVNRGSPTFVFVLHEERWRLRP